MLTSTPSVEPEVLVIRLLEACNAGCFMCDFAFSVDKYSFTLKDAQELMSATNMDSIRIVRFTGGEPLLIPEFADIAKLFQSRGIRVSVITNGWHLESRAVELSECLDQVIVSLDGSEAKYHDKFRRLPGLFDRATRGLVALRQLDRRIILRVNTVAGPHNVSDLLALESKLAELQVDQWSIIPLKRDTKAWNHTNQNAFTAHYSQFVQKMSARRNQLPRLLGFSLNWAGRTPEEFERFVRDNQPMTPTSGCALVDKVRYYVPKEGVVYPCNCVPHRADNIELGASFEANSFTSEGVGDSRKWLRRNGSQHCMGCEPVNTALAEGATNLTTDIFGF